MQVSINGLQTYIRSTVSALSIQDWPLKHVGKLMLCPQEVWTYKIHHTPVFNQVVL